MLRTRSIMEFFFKTHRSSPMKVTIEEEEEEDDLVLQRL